MSPQISSWLPTLATVAILLLMVTLSLLIQPFFVKRHSSSVTPRARLVTVVVGLLPLAKLALPEITCQEPVAPVGTDEPSSIVEAVQISCSGPASTVNSSLRMVTEAELEHWPLVTVHNTTTEPCEILLTTVVSLSGVSILA